jgi:hypothetical protein
VQLDRGVDHVVDHVRQVDLGDAVLLAHVHALLGLVGDVQEHEPRDVELARALGHHELDGLALIQLLAEGFALGDVRGGEVQRPLGHGDVVHAVTQAPVGQAMLAHVEAAPQAADDVLGRHDQILDLDLGVAAAHDVRQRALRRHGLDVALDLVAGVRQLDDEGRELLVARAFGVGARHDQGQVGDAGGRGEPLLAVQHVVLVAVLDRRWCACRWRRRPSLLGHRVADALLAVQQRLEELLLLVRGAVGDQRQDGGVVRALAVHAEGADVALAQLHLHQGVGQRAQAHAAVLLGHEGHPQALCAGLGPQVVDHLLEAGLVLDLVLGRDALVMHPLAHLLADGLGLGGDLEVDRHGGAPNSCLNAP